MADYYWVSASPGATGNWNTTGAGCRWYTTSGGVGGSQRAGPPTAADNAIFDALSGTGTVTFATGATGTCLNLLCNGLLGNSSTAMTITGGGTTTLYVNGNIDLSPNGFFVLKTTPALVMQGSTTSTIRCAGNTLGPLTIDKGTGSVTMLDDLLGLGNIGLTLTSGTLNASSYNVVFGYFSTDGTTARTLNMGSGTWTMLFEGAYGSPESPWRILNTTNFTFTKGTANIRLLHNSNSPNTNFPLVTGLRTAVPSATSTAALEITDITGFPNSAEVVINNEVIKYVGIDTANKKLGTTSITRSFYGTVGSSYPLGTGVFKISDTFSTLSANITDPNATTPIGVVDASKYPNTDGVVKVDNEYITYVGIDLVNNLLGTTSITRGAFGTTTAIHNSGASATLVQERTFQGGGLTYNNLIIAGFGYISKTNITGANTFASIASGGSGFTNTGYSGSLTPNTIYPGYFQVVLPSSTTTTVQNGLQFTGGTDGAATYQQTIASSTAGTQATLSKLPSLTGWNVGTHSVNGGNNSGLYYIAGSVDYITWQDIIALPDVPPAPGTAKAYLGYSRVVNQIQTTPGNASGVVGNAAAGLGDDVAGGGVVDVYTGVS